MDELKQLESVIAALEAQRALLGDSVTDAALAPLREKLAALRQQTVGEQRKLVTVLFADLVGFTSLAETMDPEDVREIVAAYFNRWTAQIEQFGGVVEKFIGDAVMAVFGLQTAREDDSERAIRAALAMRDELEALNRRLGQERDLQLAMRVGIHTGQVVVSLLDERKGQDFVIVGDTVNLTSRLQGIAPINGILISHDTFRLVAGVFDFQALKPVQVKGRQESVQTYAVLRAKPRSFRLEKRSVAGVETPLVGRAAELETLQNVFRKAVEHNEQPMITIVGEAGIGKSRLVEEFEQWLELLPMFILYFKGRASPYLQKQPYALLRDLFAFRFQIQDSDPPQTVRQKMEDGIGDPQAARSIGQLLGFEFGPNPDQPNSVEDAQLLHDQALAFLSQYFQRAADESPVVVILEDLHWADESSLEVLPQLRSALAGQRLAILCTARPVFLKGQPEWGQDQPSTTFLHLERLSQEASRQLLGEILQKVENTPPGLADLLVAQAEGNPFYLEELIKMLVEEGTIVREDNHWRVEEELLASLHIPPTLTEVLQARFDSLPPDERLLLQRASVIGRTFWDQAVEYLGQPGGDTRPKSDQLESGNDQHTLEKLDGLRSREIIVQHDGSAFDGTREYFFNHALLRDVTYESLLKRHRRLYHALAARWLEGVTGQSQRTDEYAALIAEHYEQAEELQPAAHWYRRAGDLAAARFANAEAVHNLSRALALTPDEALSGRYDLLLARIRVLDRQGLRTAQQADMVALAALAEQLDDDARRAEALVRQAELSFVQGDYAPCVEAAHRAVPLAQATRAAESEVRAYLCLGKVRTYQGDHRQAEDDLRRGLNLARETSLPALEAELVWNLSIVASNTGDYPTAAKLLNEALLIYRRLGDQAGEGIILGQIGVVFLFQAEYAKAREYIEAALVIYQATGHRLREAIALSNLGVAAYEQGDFSEAIRWNLEALELYETVRDKFGQASVLGNLGDIARQQGRYEDSREYYRQALQGAREIEDPLLQGINLANLCLLSIQTNDVPAALETGRQAVEYTRLAESGVYESTALLRLAQALMLDGQFEESRQTYRQALELQGKLGLENNAIESLAGLARLALQQGDLKTAGTHVTKILEHLQTGDHSAMDEPVRIYLTCYHVLSERQHPSARQVLETAHSFLKERAEQIEDEAQRRSFLESIAAHQELIRLIREVHERHEHV